MQVLNWIGALALAGGTIGAADQVSTPAFAAGITTAVPPTHLARSFTNAVSSLEHVGKVTSWARVPGSLLLKCGELQAVRIDILTERLFRVRFSADGSFPESFLHEPWRLVKANHDYPHPPFAAVERDRAVEITTSALSIHIEKHPLRLSVFDGAGHLLSRESASPGMGIGQRAELRMDRAPEEHFFGLGEGLGTTRPEAGFATKTILDIPLHGTQLEGGAITLDQTGKKTFLFLGPNWSGFTMTPVVIPFFMSTKGYGIYLNDFRDSIFDLACTHTNAWSIGLGGPPHQVPPAGVLDYYFLYGPSFKEILDVYTDLTGRTPLVPKWSLGYFQICDFNQTQAEVLRIAQDFRRRDFPCDVLLLEPGWMKTPYRMDGWSTERFPDPEAMIAALTRQNFKLGLWQCGPADWVFTSWDRLARKANRWGADITNPAEVEKYKAFHRPYYDQGISFFKQDGCGQAEWQPDEPYHNGLTGKEMHNIIPTLYSKIMFEAYKVHTGRRAMNFSPHAGPSAQRFPGIWPSGDGGGGHNMFLGELNLGLSGHTYTSHDFADRSSAGVHWSLLGPWCPGALSAIPQGNLCQFYLKLRYQLIPYIYSTHRQAHRTGSPYLRAMVLEYQDDPATYTLDRQCMLGDWFLLATYTKDVYLPAGTWTDYWSGDTFDSKGEWQRNVRWPATVGGPLFVKGGAIIPMGPVTPCVDQEPLEIVRLDIYPQGDSTYSLYEDDGATYDYEKGLYARTEFHSRQRKSDVLITMGDRRGTYRNMPNNRSYLLSVHCPAEPAAILKGTEILPQHPTKNDLLAEGARKGWHYDRQNRIAWIKPMAGWYYAADDRKADDPEKDSVYWVESGTYEEKSYDIRIELP